MASHLPITVTPPAEGLRLEYLPANQAWVWTWMDQLLQVGDGPVLHLTRDSAVAAAEAQGFTVTGNVGR